MFERGIAGSILPSGWTGYARLRRWLRAYRPVLNATTRAIAIQPDGGLVVGGGFTRAQSSGSATALVRNHLARFDAEGRLDASFELAGTGRIFTTAPQADGRVRFRQARSVNGGAWEEVADFHYVARK